MFIKGIIDEDFVNYKRIAMCINFPRCSFKCEKENRSYTCQNNKLVNTKNIDVGYDEIVKRYIGNPITSAIVCAGLEPMDSWRDLLNLLSIVRQHTNDDFVIYTGYTEEEVKNKISILSHYKNVIIKFGRYIPNQEIHFDTVLGVNLASNNQYAKKIS